jgi:hypothetical protein
MKTLSCPIETYPKKQKKGLNYKSKALQDLIQKLLNTGHINIMTILIYSSQCFLSASRANMKKV